MEYSYDYVEPRTWEDRDQEWFDLAVVRLLRDLFATTDIRPLVEVDLSDPESPDTPYRYSPNADAPAVRHGRWLERPESAAEAVAAVADPLADDVVEKTRGRLAGLPRSWPSRGGPSRYR